jgi:hypothetical protein
LARARPRARGTEEQDADETLAQARSDCSKNGEVICQRIDMFDATGPMFALRPWKPGTSK